MLANRFLTDTMQENANSPASAMRTFEKTYEIKKGPPPPDIDEYLAIARKEWKRLLESDPAENLVQDFLEKNPMFVPGALTPGTKSGHAPHLGSLVAQPKLPGLSAKIPDFMWISTHSTHWYPTLIEIERPSKQIFTKRGVPTAEFTQARHQLAEWRAWFSRPANIQQFISEYGVPEYMTSGRQMQPHMILIYGRRSEVDGNPALELQRGSLLHGGNEELMSFDRIGPELDMHDAITVSAKGAGMYEARYLPPTFRFHPLDAEKFRNIDGVVESLNDTPMISEERRQFLISRYPYWKEWALRGQRGTVNSGDWE